MSQTWQVRLFYTLTIVSLLSGVLVLWRGPTVPTLQQMYDLAIYIISQGILMIWCVRDLYKRRFPHQRTLLNWYAAFLFLGVFATTAYLLLVKRHQWVPNP